MTEVVEQCVKIASSRYPPNIVVLCFDILAGFVREDHPCFVQNLDSFLSLYSKLSKSLTVLSLLLADG